MRYTLGYVALALMSGALLRLADAYGLPILRMAGFWVLSGAGFLAAYEIARQQEAWGSRRFVEALEACEGVKVEWAVPGYVALVEQKGRWLVFVADGMPGYGWSPLVRQRLEKARERARQVSEEIKIKKGLRLVTPVVVLLRRKAPENWKKDLIINPEDIPNILQCDSKP